MIWQLDRVSGLIPAFFVPAGQPDQQVIDQFLANSKHPPRPMADQDEPRRYYLLVDDPRIKLVSVSQTLETWPEDEAAMLIVGTLEIIGEFTANRHLVGQKGLSLKLQPLAWLTRGEPDLVLADGAALLAEISTQGLDLAAFERRARAKVQSPPPRPGRQWKI